MKIIKALLLPYISIGVGLYCLKGGWLAILFYHAGMVLFLILDKKRPPFRQMFRGWHKTWAWLIPLCGLGGISIYLLWPWMQQQLDLDTMLTKYGLSGWKWTAFLIYYSLGHPPLEEFYWRGYLGHKSKKVRIEDLAFGGYHFFTMICFVGWPWALLSCTILTGTAWLWRQIVRETGGLLVPVLTHIVADISVIWMVNALL
ncbi:CPBP family intramembrane metalloprotease [bacterium]|nr:CPBP family intramembrane metalloprotease [bacterium]